MSVAHVAAVVWILPWAWELLYAADATIKRKKKWRERTFSALVLGLYERAGPDALKCKWQCDFCLRSLRLTQWEAVHFWRDWPPHLELSCLE